MITELAPAKVNLNLHLTGIRADGYHFLESLVVFADVGDFLAVDRASALSLKVTGPKAAGVPAGTENLVMKAALHLRALRGVTSGAEITLAKHLPHGGGIGGGSSDAASAIRLLSRLWNVAPLTADEALVLGADVPVCLNAPAPAIMSGIGEKLTPPPPLPEGWLVLINPGIHIPTVAVFQRHDAQYDQSNPGLEPFAAHGLTAIDFQAWLMRQRNDLTKVTQATDFAPVIGEILGTLRACKGVNHADMSGSGSTCWAWFSEQSKANAAVRILAADRPDWWVVLAKVMRPMDQLIRATT